MIGIDEFSIHPRAAIVLRPDPVEYVKHHLVPDPRRGCDLGADPEEQRPVQARCVAYRRVTDVLRRHGNTVSSVLVSRFIDDLCQLFSDEF